MAAYDPNLDRVINEVPVPGTHLNLKLMSYNGGEAKVHITRIVIKRAGKEDETVTEYGAGRLTVDEFRAVCAAGASL